MSVFKVQLVSPNQGSGVATDPAASSGVSIQKTMEVTGPNLTRRRLYDGETFTSTNYWKRFASVADGGSMAAETAFIKVLSDDGSPYSDMNPNVNKFAVVIDKTITASTTFSEEDNQIDILGTYGGVALFTQIVTDENIKVRLNGSTTADLDVAEGSQTFDNSDLPLTSIAFSNAESGATNATVQVLLTIQIQSKD